MRANSLALRLFLWATGWTLVILVDHRRRAVVALSPRRRARFRPPPRRLSAHAGGRCGVARGRQRQVPAIDRRAAVRAAVVGLVLAGDAARYQKAGSAFLALAVGLEPAAPAQRQAYARTEVPARLCAGPRGAEAAARRAQHRSRRRRPLFDCGRRRRFRDRRRDPQLRPRHRRHLRGAHHRIAVDYGVTGALRPGAADAHFAEPRGDPLRAGPSGSRASFPSRSPRLRARPMR